MSKPEKQRRFAIDVTRVGDLRRALSHLDGSVEVTAGVKFDYGEQILAEVYEHGHGDRLSFHITVDAGRPEEVTVIPLGLKYPELLDEYEGVGVIEDESALTATAETLNSVAMVSKTSYRDIVLALTNICFNEGEADELLAYFAKSNPRENS